MSHFNPVIECVAETDNTCGESPVWDPRDRALFWVDIYRPSLWRYSPSQARLESRPLECLVSAIGLRRSGGFVAATEYGFAILDWPTAKCRMLSSHHPDRPRHRFNDGKCDRHGRFWAGTVDTNRYGNTGELFRLDGDGTTHRVDEGYITQNGLAFSPDGKTLYVSDSRQHVIFAYDLDEHSGTLFNRRQHISTEPPSRPDGATVDSSGNYWCALSRGWHIAAYYPDGTELHRIHMPVEHPLMCAFGGDNLDTLYVTSGTFALDADGRAAQKLAGGLFAISGLGVQGIAEPYFTDDSKSISWMDDLPKR